MSQEILEKVCSIVSEQLSVESGEVKSDSNFQNDLGADSLDTVELVMALEEAFDIEIPDEAAEGIATVGDAVKFIEEKTETEILAIGIGHDVSRYYNRAIKITDVNELGDVMISQLSELFKSKKNLH